MAKNKKIAGVIILYNSDEEVLKNINSYLPYIEQLFVIDNSDRKDELLTNQIINSPKTRYIDNKENLGVAKALNIGCKQALESGYHWVLTMDQDSRFESGEFFDLFKKYDTTDIAIFAASFINKYDRWIKNYDDNFLQIHYVITSGNIVDLRAWNAVGGFEEKLFIDEVDHDFCAKLFINKLKVLTTRRIFLTHSLGINIEVKGIADTHSSFRHYYMTRNILFIAKKYLFKDFKLSANRLYILFKSSVRIILFYPQKAQYFKYILLGMWHFILKKYGKLIVK